MIYLWTNGPPVTNVRRRDLSKSPWANRLAAQSASVNQLHKSKIRATKARLTIEQGGYTKNNKKQHLRMWDFLDQLHIRYISIWYLWVHPDIASWRYPQSHDSCPMGNLWWTMGSKGRVDHVAARCTVFFCWVSEVKKHTLMCIYNCIHNYTHTVYNICIMYIYIYT